MRVRRKGAVRATVLAVTAIVVSFGLAATAAGSAPCSPITERHYVALGDSYASGYGLGDASGDCSRSTAQSYPNRTKAALGITSFVNVTCAGATTSSLAGKQGSNAPQFDALSSSTDLASLTIGGNDLGFTDILTNCATSSDCRGDYGGNTMPTLLTKVSTVVGPKVEAAFRAALTKAPNAQIFVLGYPDLLPAGPTGISWTVSCGATATVISDGERTALRGVEKALNDEIRKRALAVGGRIRYVDVYTPSIGHDLCSNDNWTAGVATLYHPTSGGHAAMSALLVSSIQTTVAAVCAASTTTTTAPTTTSTTAPTTTTTEPVTGQTVNESFIVAGYQDFLFRSPTAAERVTARAALGGSAVATAKQRADFVTGLANSDQYLGAIVQKMYRDTLGRNGDQGGIAYWTNQLRTGRRSVAQVAGEFYASNEYFQGYGGGDVDRWIGDLYRKLLLRTADRGGLEHWRLVAYRSGRTAVSTPMFQSNESARTRVNNVYLALLGRPGETAGIAFWAPKVVKDGDVVLAVNLGGSNEYLTRAKRRFP